MGGQNGTQEKVAPTAIETANIDRCQPVAMTTLQDGRAVQSCTGMGALAETAAPKALETTQYLNAIQVVQKTNIQEAQDYMRIKSELKDYIKPQNLKKFRQKEVQKRELQIQQQLDHHQINQEQDSRKVIEKSAPGHDSN
jgi:hypothetical protein